MNTQKNVTLEFLKSKLIGYVCVQQRLHNNVRLVVCFFLLLVVCCRLANEDIIPNFMRRMLVFQSESVLCKLFLF